MLVFKDNIVHRRGFMLADLAFSAFNLFKGAVVAVLRLTYSLLFFGVTFMRADVNQLPPEAQHWDSATAAYNSVVVQHVLFFHPLKWAFTHVLIQRMKRRRWLLK